MSMVIAFSWLSLNADEFGAAVAGAAGAAGATGGGDVPWPISFLLMF
jgi:hypothetical protein